MRQDNAFDEKMGHKGNPLDSFTPYDDAFRTMEGECDDLLIPLVNYFFHEDYGTNARVTRLRNEHFVESPDGSNKKKITDSHFGITDRGRSKLYHLECESGKYDGTILVKMFEYGSQIAVDGNINNKIQLNVSFPNAGVLLLRGRENDPNDAGIVIETPGGSVNYSIPIYKVRDFDTKVIFENRLYFLIPFLIFNDESRFSILDKDEKSRNELVGKYHKLMVRLSDEVDEGRLSGYSLSLIVRFVASIWNNITAGYKTLQEKVGDIMGGHVLELDVVVAHRQGVAEGKAEGAEEQLISMICRKLKKGKTVSQIAEDLEESEIDISKIYTIARKYAPDYDEEKIIEEYWREKTDNKREVS